MANCQNNQMGLPTLIDMTSPYDRPGGTSPHDGGVYPGWSNIRPAVHERRGRRQAGLIEPLDSSGAPSPAGQVGFAVLGFSEGEIVGRLGLIPQVAADPDAWSALKIANCAVPGADAVDLASISNPYWTVDVPAKLALAGLDARQVQVAWIFTGVAVPAVAWPGSVTYLADLFVACVQSAKAVFPNLRQLYVSNPTYKGYAQPGPAPEPTTCEHQFATKELVARQIADDPALNVDRPGRPVLAPWIDPLLLWTDGSTTRQDGLYWSCPTHLLHDGSHPSKTGAEWLSSWVRARWKQDPCSRPWYTGIPNPTTDGAGTTPPMTGTLG